MTSSTASTPAVTRTHAFWGHSFTFTPADEGNVWVELEGYHAMHWSFAVPLAEASPAELDNLCEDICLFNDIEPLGDED